jgi:hypothetical protein
MTHHFVGTLPAKFIFWNVQDNSFTFYQTKYSGYIGISRYTLSAMPLRLEDSLVKRDPLHETFGFTELTDYGHFFFCQTKYYLQSLGQIIVGLSTCALPVTRHSTYLYGISTEELSQSLRDTQELFSRHPDLPFIVSTPAVPYVPPVPSAPFVDQTEYQYAASAPLAPAAAAPLAPAAAAPLAPAAAAPPAPLPTERLALALARDSIQQKEICLITQEALTSGEVAVTACHCVFQAPLLTQWATNHTTCPACRTQLVFRIVTV